MLIAYIWNRWNLFHSCSAFHGEDVKRAKRITESVGQSHNLQGGYQTRFKKKLSEETTLPPSISETSGVERKKMPIKAYDNMYCSKGND